MLNFPQNFEVEMVADALEFINLTHEINNNFLPLNKIKLQKRVELFKKDARVRKILKLRTEYMEKNNFHTPRTVDFGLQIFNKVLNKLLVKARRNYWTNSLSKLEQKDDMWSIFKQFKNKKTHIPQEIAVDDIAIFYKNSRGILHQKTFLFLHIFHLTILLFRWNA